MTEIPLSDNEREYPNEYTEVERPLLLQLRAMGWQFVQGDIDYPEKTFRERFRDILLRPKLRDAIRRINRDDDGNEFLDDVTIERAIQELERTTRHSLLGKNEELTEKLITGVSVERAEGGGDSGQRRQHVKFIEFDPQHADRNDFLAINQFRVDFVGSTGFVIPDIVLFVNGIPLGVVECKSPSIAEPMQEGINQLLRYSNNRPEVEEPEGVEHLFLFNQLMVSTWFYEARVATYEVPVLPSCGTLTAAESGEDYSNGQPKDEPHAEPKSQNNPPRDNPGPPEEQSAPEKNGNPGNNENATDNRQRPHTKTLKVAIRDYDDYPVLRRFFKE